MTNKSINMDVLKVVKSFFWHRRDLRIEDNKGLFMALSESSEVIPIFIFDRNILDNLKKDDQRIIFIYNSIQELRKKYKNLNSDLKIYFGYPKDLIPNLVNKYQVNNVYTNRDYEPYAQERDKEIKTILDLINVSFKGYKDHVIFEKNEILKEDQKPYTVFTPYANKWKKKLNIKTNLIQYPTENYFSSLFTCVEDKENITLQDMGFNSQLRHAIPGQNINEYILQNYSTNRDFPSKNGTSKLSVHLRFGTISIRQLALKALVKSESYLNELIWRDFYQMIIFHFPHSAKNSFKFKYDFIAWENNENDFKLWCEGKTGYPLVDAGMRELNSTGFMHNRVRMVVASFLTKHLLIDWRWGEAYFAEKLLDYELSSNVGGWQWASGSGCDAAPYFRVFNPKTQQEKFDKDLKYIKNWIPEYDEKIYLKPIVDHAFARNRAIERYKQALKS